MKALPTAAFCRLPSASSTRAPGSRIPHGERRGGRRRIRKGITDMALSRFFRIEVNEEALTDALYEFVTDPRPTRGERPVIHELHEINPDMMDVLECMVLDGTEERQDVADYVHAVFHGVTA